MQNTLFFVAALTLLSTAAFFLLNSRSSNKTISSSPEAQLFSKWLTQFNKSYKTQEEEAYRLSVFLANLEFIKAHNKQVEVHGFEMEANQFSDLTNDEFRQTFLGLTSKNLKTSRIENIHVSKTVDIPSSVNWTALGDVTPVKDQGQCGSCWAFSTTGALESDSAIFGSGLQSFSEQQLVDCSDQYGNQGCNGGEMSDAFKYVIANGITTEEAYPYTGVQAQCKINGGAFKIKSYSSIPKGDCNALQNAVAQQPVSVGVDAQTWQFYSKGIFSLCGKTLDHGVLVTGYSPTYWIVKNSWSPSWGQNGFIQLKFGNTCGICNDALYPNLN